MTDETIIEPVKKPRPKPKRDIFRFNGEMDTAINMEHVQCIDRSGKRITFQFSATTRFVEFLDDDAASKVYEYLLNTWSADVLE